MKPEMLGTFEVYDVTSKSFGSLDFWDAINDGFRELHELKEELKRLTPGIIDDTTMFINWVQNAKNAEGQGNER